MLKPIHASVAGLAVCLSLSVQTALADEEGKAAEAAEASEKIEEKPVPVARVAPGASTAMTFDDLEIRGVHGLTDMVAGNRLGLIIQPSNFNSANLSLTVRGTGATTPHQATGDPGVGVFIDGAYIARSQGLSLDLLDIDAVNVVRGAQPVMGGRNTTGGAVYLTPSRPTGKAGFEQKIHFGEIGDEFTSITHINLPKFADMLSTKVSYLMHNHDGWVENTTDENFWVRDNEGLRVALRFDQEGAFTYDYSFLNAEVKSTAPYQQNLIEQTFDDTVSLFTVDESDVDIKHHSQTVSLQGDKATLTANISYREVDSVSMEARIGGATHPNRAYIDPSKLDQKQFSQRLQFDTRLLDGGLDLTLGLENFAEQVELDEVLYIGNSEVESFALYAQGILELTDTVELTLGWRETSEEKEIESQLFEGNLTASVEDIEDDNTSFNVALALDVTEQLRVFTAFKNGFKSGGASLYSASLDPGGANRFGVYDAEEMDSIELGVEGRLMDDKIIFSLVGFTNDVSDKQVATYDPANIRIADVVNASEDATIDGGELELQLELVEGLRLSGLYTYLDAEDINVQGMEVHAPGAPRHAGSAALDWAVGEFEAGAVKLHLSYHGTSSYFFDSINEQKSSRDVINARVSASGFQLEDDSGRIEIGIWANNLSDDEYLVNGATTSTAAFGAFGEPRSYGIDFRYER